MKSNSITSQINKKTDRAPLAYVGSQTSHEEDVFGALFDGKVIKRFVEYLRPYKTNICLAIGAVLVVTFAQLSIPLIVQHAIDEVILVDKTDSIPLFLVIIFFSALITINYGANWLQDRLIGMTGEQVIFDLRKAMYSHIQNISLSFMDKTETGRMMSRLTGDVNSLQEFLENSVTAFGDLVLLFGIVIIMLSLDFTLGALTLSVVPILFFVRIFWLPRARIAFRYARETNSIANGALAEGIRSVRTVQSMRRECVNYHLYNKKVEENLSAHLKSARMAQVMVPVVDTLTGAAMGIVILVGGALVLDNSLDIGVIVAFIFYVQRFFDPIRSLTIQYSVMQRAMASGKRIFEVLDVPISIADDPKAIRAEEIRGLVEFRNVTFSYDGVKPVLENLNFTISPGETVALVGPTGSGKTSITSLLHRFYEVSEGSILIDNIDIKKYEKSSLGEHISMVLQDPFLFTGTILENIRYKTDKATLEQVVNAAKTVGAHGFITEMEHSYETEVEEQGRNLSLGQRQLISFARALVANAKILVLDEATASIDSHTEKKIQIALKKLLKGRTGIVIAHRLATIRGADRIIVIKNGKLVEMGPHKSLVKKQGLYSQLHKLNYASFDDVRVD